MEPTATSRTGISLPDTMRAFVLDGPGFDYAGTRCIETQHRGPGQLVGRVDAAGLCSSINKVIAQRLRQIVESGRVSPQSGRRTRPGPGPRRWPISDPPRAAVSPRDVLGAGYFSR
jgi:hypothetical protein